MLFSVVILVALTAFWVGLNPLTKMLDARTRKLAFWGAIIAFFFVMLFHRRGEVEAAAETHDLRETNIGQVNLGGSTARFVLASFRGPLVCMLWWDSEERKERHQYQQLDLIYDSLTTLQPHFRSPWIYQGWNFAYNISVEFDRVEDKYVYIARGIQRLAEGEKINRSRLYDPALGRRREIGDPDMRWHIGFMIQQKMSVSDEVNTHRCLFHLSCIPPDQWDPARLRRNPEAMAEFKRTYPQLVRQIQMLKNIPEGAEKQLNSHMLEFFAAHRRVPSLYPPENLGEAGAAEFKPFPIWPETLRPTNVEREEHHNSFEIAKNWFIFSVEPLPLPFYEEDLDLNQLRFYRVPKRMVTIIFRKQPAQAKGLQARQLDKEGWFGPAQKAWDEALQMWLEYGVMYKLEMKEDEFKERLAGAQRHHENFREEAAAGLPPPKHRRNDQNMKDYHDFLVVRRLEERRQLANYHYWKSASVTMASNETTEARKHLYQAHANRTDVQASRAEFEKGFELWKPILIKPRPLDASKSEAVFLLGLTLNAIPQSFPLQPIEIFDRTEFGKNHQGQEELGQFHDFYMAVRARTHASDMTRAAVGLWQLQHLLSAQAASPAALGPLTAIPTPRYPLHCDQIEDLLMATATGPLDNYLHPEVISRSFRFGRTATRDRLLPSTTAEGGPVTTPPTMLQPSQQRPDRPPQ